MVDKTGLSRKKVPATAFLANEKSAIGCEPTKDRFALWLDSSAGDE
jgi:hypothetical protein